jgi:hypothetical protein
MTPNPRTRSKLAKSAWAVIPAAAVLSLVGVSVAAAAGGSGPASSDLPPGKATAITAASPPSEQEQEAVINSYSAALRAQAAAPTAAKPQVRALAAVTGSNAAALQHAGQDLVQRDYELLADPADTASRRKQATDPAKLATLRSQIAAIWTPAHVASRYADVAANLQLQAGTPSMLTFDATKLTTAATSTT